MIRESLFQECNIGLILKFNVIYHIYKIKNRDTIMFTYVGELQMTIREKENLKNINFSEPGVKRTSLTRYKATMNNLQLTSPRALSLEQGKTTCFHRFSTLY